jgi:hypothetical protein
MLSTVIVGGGPGGIGPLIAAAQLGCLPRWLDRGVAIVDRSQSLGGTLGRYIINSDTAGGAYLECLEAAHAPAEMRALLGHPISCELESFRFGLPPLSLVHRYMELLGSQLATMMEVRAPGTAHNRTEAKALHLERDGTVRLDAIGPDGMPKSIRSQTAIIALGGVLRGGFHHLKSGMRLSDCKLNGIISSDELMTKEGVTRVACILRAQPGRPVVILGGSHSGYAAASALVHLIPPNRLPPLQIALLQRRQPPVFYASVAAADADDYPITQKNVCARTLRVHRLGGLRGDGREIWRRVHGHSGPPLEARVEASLLSAYRASELRNILESAALVVTAFGYRAATLPIFDDDGCRIALSADQGDVSVNDECRILLEDGRPLRNVFGVGLGSGYRPTGSMGGEASFKGQANSLWLYQNDIGTLIFRGICTILRERSHNSREDHFPLEADLLKPKSSLKQSRTFR